MKKRQTIYTIGASFFIMLIMAITESIRGILIPTFKVDFGVNDTSIGVFLFIASLAYVISTHFAGKMVKHFGQKRTAIVGMVISGTGFFGTSFAVTFSHLIIGYIVLTIGISFIIMSLNTIVPLLQISYLGIVMNFIHLFYGIGATITQRVSGFLISSGISWRTIFVAFSVMYIVAIVVYSFVKQPERSKTENHDSKIKPFEKKIILLFCLALGFYITAEIQTANWLLNYLKEVYNYNENNGSFYVAFFFGAISIGRLFGGYLLEKIGYLKGIIISLAIALVLYILGLYNEKTLILISVSGLFFSIVYPTTILVLQNYFHENVTKVITIVTMAASAVSMVLGYVVGFLNDKIGVVNSYYLIPFSLFLSLVFVIEIYRETKHIDKKRLEE